MKYNLGIWGPIAWDQFCVEVIGEDDNKYTEIYFQPSWGGCGLNQALNFDKLNRTCSNSRGAYLLSSVGKDFYKKEAKFQGRNRSNVLSLLENIKPVLIDSENPTTSFNVKVNVSISRCTPPLRKIIKSNKRIDHRLESQIHSFEQNYKMMGTSIKDLENKDDVFGLLQTILNEYPRFMSVSGGTFEMQKSIIYGIREFESSKKLKPCTLLYDPGPVVHFLATEQRYDTMIQPVLNLLSHVNILKTNKKENYLLKGGKDSGVFILLEQIDTVIVTSPKKVNAYIKRGKKIERTDFSGLPLIKADTTGCGDVFGSSLLWSLYDIESVRNDDVLNAIPFAMSVSVNYLEEKQSSRRLGISDYSLNLQKIKALEKRIRKETKTYSMS